MPARRVAGWMDWAIFLPGVGSLTIAKPDSGQYDSTTPVAWASGAALFVRANVYHEAVADLMNIFLHTMEEIDLCWRMQRSGYKVMACSRSQWCFMWAAVLCPGAITRKTFLNYRNNLIMLWKNLPAGQLALKLPLRLLLDALSAWKALLGGDGGYFMAVLKAHVWFGVLVPVCKEKHAPGTRGQTWQWPPNGYFTGSIVWAYFIKKRQKFSEIVNA